MAYQAHCTIPQYADWQLNKRFFGTKHRRSEPIHRYGIVDWERSERFKIRTALFGGGFADGRWRHAIPRRDGSSSSSAVAMATKRHWRRSNIMEYQNASYRPAWIRNDNIALRGLVNQRSDYGRPMFEAGLATCLRPASNQIAYGIWL